ncbi:ATP-binding protein [Nitratireductor sp. XY-223]|uniref:ATP-binding protein n=1 Tax=Nitratireductor sp. XY-223 TaxID=2561926 RepID=UPI0010A9A7CB|nr:ATP-binding protein [Nitratireductor sp. XY-223]
MTAGAGQTPGAEALFDPALGNLDTTLAALVVRRVRLAAAGRAAFLHRLWSEEERDNNARPVDRLARQLDNAEAEAAFRQEDPEATALTQASDETAALLSQFSDPAYRRLVDIFGLDDAEQALLHMALAAEYDPTIGPLLRHVSLHERADYPNDALAARLFGGQAAGLWRADGPAARWRILIREPMGPDLPERIAVDPSIRRYLGGEMTMPDQLMGLARIVGPREPLSGWPVTQTAARLSRMLEDRREEPVTVAVHGQPGSGRKTFCAAVASELGLSLLASDLDRAALTALEDVAIAAHRHAYFAGAAVLLEGQSTGAARLPVDLAPFPLTFVVSGSPTDASPGQAGQPSRPTIAVDLGVPGVDERAALWRRLCPSSSAWRQGEIEILASRHRTLPGTIARAAETLPASGSEAGETLRAMDRERFGSLAQHVACAFTFDDLVLPERPQRQIRTLVHEAKARERFWEKPGVERLFPQGRGLTALFAGPPGTGKTMAAQVIAAELELDLYRVDMSSLVSKYIGETMENVQRILDIARSVDAVLLFDEADGFFARRTELNNSNDRHANQDTGHLLQAIEAYPGIALLASNRRRNIDEAFTRRLRYIVEFPPPDEAARRRIWRQILAEVFGAATLARLSDPVDRIARRVDVTGAQIKQALLTAAFAADADGSDLDVAHVLDGIDAELMKDGRALTARDRANLEAGQ